MGCREIREQISEYLDGRMSPADRQEMEAHLFSCADCRKEYEALLATARLLRAMPEMPAPEGFLESVRDRIERDKVVPLWSRAANRINEGLNKVPLRAMTVAASVVLVILVTLVATHNDVGKKYDHELATMTPTGELGGATGDVELDLASTNPATSVPLYVETPNEFVMSIVREDPSMAGYKVYPHPKGMGALVDTGDKLYEIILDPSEFPFIQAKLEHMGGRMPESLSEARGLYPIYIRVLPSPTTPLDE